ncbi:DUF547 domain-containing protein [soil metagenome]
MKKITFRRLSLRLLSLMCLGMFACGNPYNRIKNNNSQPVTHGTWDELLHQHVSPEGAVHYQGLLQDSLRLRQYLDQLGQNPPNNQNWTPDERKAYFLNLYNAATVQLILRHYPVQSIKDIGPNLQIPFVRTPWTIPFIPIADQKMTLDNIEHGIIRREFEDPRIHFAVNCAAHSCPVLHNRAYAGDRVNEQLDQQARQFINDTRFNRITPDSIHISSIFKWYSGDFPKGKAFIDYLNQYSKVKINPNATVTYADYDWKLNERNE